MLTNRYTIVMLIVLLVLLPVKVVGQQNRSSEFQKQKSNMIENQIKARGIDDSRVIEAMKTVERHLFVPENLKNKAYQDSPLPIGYGQTISQPFIVAYMTQLLDLKSSSKVLEVGTGSGYQAAILAEICAQVYSIEINEPLAKQAQERLSKLGYTNIYLKQGDGYLGWPEYAPFDAIIVTCAPSHIPEPLINQLAEGGKLIIPYGKSGTIQNLDVLLKKEGALKKLSTLPVRFVPMVDPEGDSY